MSKLTLITACYNSEATIMDTLQSVNEQDYRNIDHIIVDGASIDNTIKICQTKGTRISKIISEPDAGIYDAYNKGIANAQGEIIGFLNSDDYYASGNVCSQVMDAFNDPTIDAVHADLVYVNQTKTNIVERYWRSKNITRGALISGFIPAHPTVFFRRSVYDRIGNFDLTFRLAADNEFLLRAFYTHQVSSKYIPGIWVRMRSGGATGGSIKSIIRQNREILKAQEKHNLSCSKPRFYAYKIADRIMQRIRAQTVQAPNFLKRDTNDIRK